MAQEEKSLLLQDLCARLPYGVILSVTLKDKYDDIVNRDIELTEHNLGYITKASNWQEYKPYLRPMSSMTKEEFNKLDEYMRIYSYNIFHKLSVFCKAQDYLNSIHVDYRGLIEKGLALEAPEDMYNLKEK